MWVLPSNRDAILIQLFYRLLMVSLHIYSCNLLNRYVCKAFHARRCLMLYQMAFPDAAIKVCPVHCFNITKENWYKSEQGIDRVLGELARCGNQFAGDIKAYLL